MSNLDIIKKSINFPKPDEKLSEDEIQEIINYYIASATKEKEKNEGNDEIKDIIQSYKSPKNENKFEAQTEDGKKISDSEIVARLLDGERQKQEIPKKQVKFCDVPEARKKDLDEIPKEIKNKVKLVSVNPKKSEIFGSYVNRAQFYPGDIDVHEVIDSKLSREDTYKKALNGLLKVVKRLKKEPFTYFGEVKTGVDRRFDISIDHPQFLSRIDSLYMKGLLTSDEVIMINDAYHSKNDIDKRDIIEEFMRQKKTVRWTENDVLKGYKILVGGVKKTLMDAIKDNGYLKLDVWTRIDGNFTEMTNFWLLVYMDKSGKIEFLNGKPVDYIEAMYEQILEYSRPMFFNPFKMLKRLWNIAKYTCDGQLLHTLTPLFQGNVARINVIISELDAMKLIVEHVNSKSYVPEMIKQIDDIKARLSHIYDIPSYDEETIFYLINKITRFFRIYRRDNLVKGLEKLKKILKDIRNEESVDFLHKHEINLMPKKLLTHIPTYEMLPFITKIMANQ